MNRDTMKKTDEKLKQGMWEMGRNAINKHYDVIKSGKHKCKFYINADWTGYCRCECGKEYKESDL